MSRWEYRLASLLLRVLGGAFSLLPVRRRRVVLATARLPILEGNLLFLDRAIRRLRPGTECVHLLEPYAYGLAGKLRYLVRLVRGSYYLRTSGLVIVDNAWLPVHVAPHRPETTVVQVWHAAGALKRFGADVQGGLEEPERTFLHRHYDYAIASGDAGRGPWSRALRTPVERVLPLGTPRTDLFYDEAGLAAAKARIIAAHPLLAGRTVVLYAPTFRGRGRAKAGSDALDAEALRASLPPDHVLVLKSHPNLDPSRVHTAGFDVVGDPGSDMNEWLAAADLLITDYSSSIFEWALLRRPLVLLVDDLEAYERDPGLYLDYRTEMIGVQVRDTAGVAAAIAAGTWDLAAYDAFIERNLGACDGRSSDRIVERFIPARARPA
ncbi:MAG TPA: CDP-glycerol glycerophosphotransferase family protein [Candidatus Limnocylindrales bacterium]|nr:CDP-glycerol glycerophosphotransferase family protein [Candidatus Limnocylindrales bacterium]